MQYVSNSQVAQWYGAACTQPTVQVKLAGSNVSVAKEAARAFRFMQLTFKTYCPKYLRNDLAERHLDDWGGVCRHIAGTRTWSKHAYWVAVDIDADENAQGVPANSSEIWRKGKGAVVILEKTFFTWGGRFSNPDPHHFEVAVRPARLRACLDNSGKPRPWYAKEIGWKGPVGRKRKA